MSMGGAPLAAQDWVSSGPMGGAVRSLIRHPEQPAEVMLATVNAGPYHSTDGGRSWVTVMAGLGDTALAWQAVPAGSNDWLAFSELVPGLFRLERSPSRWGLLPTSPSVGQTLQTLKLVVAAPSRPRRVYAISTTGQVFRSEDAGQQWARVGQLNLLATDTLASAAVSHQDPEVLLVSTSNGLQRTLNGGVQWERMSAAEAALGQSFARIVLDPASNASGYLITFARVRGLQTQGGGLIESPPLPGGVADRYTHAAYGTTGPWFLRPPDIHAPTGSGSWQALLSPDLEVAPGRRASASQIDIRRQPGQPDTVLIGTDGPGVYASADGGASWQSANSGLDASNIRALAVARGQPTLLFSGRGEVPGPAPVISSNVGYRALFRSLDGATGDWQPVPIPLRFVRDVVFDPRNTDQIGTTRVFAVGAGIFRSDDGGVTWIDLGGRSEALGGFPEDPGTIRRLVFTGDPDTVVIAAGTGVYRSTNLGATWTRVTGGLLMLSLAQDPTNPNVIYLGASADLAATSARIDSVYRSTDGGLTWAATGSNGLPDPDPSGAAGYFLHWAAYSIAVHPGNPNRLWIATGSGAQPGRIYRSDDAGVNWTRADRGIGGSDTREIVVDPNDGMHLLAVRAFGVAGGSPLYRSRDGGQTWHSYAGTLQDRSSNATRVQFDPNDSSRILIGTDRGVFVRQITADADMDGLADTIENAAPLEGDGNQDQIPDRLQSQVASQPLADGTWPGNSADVIRDLTIWSEPVTGECRQIEDARTLPATGFPADRGGPLVYGHPLGLIAFELRRCQAADLYFRVHGADFSTVMPSVRLYGSPDPLNRAAARWFALPGSPTRVTADTIRIRLNATTPGNLGDSSDSIRFVGSLSLRDDLFADRFEN